MSGCAPGFFLGNGEDLTQPYDDQTEGYPHNWAGLWGCSDVVGADERGGRWETLSGYRDVGGIGERTIV